MIVVDAHTHLGNDIYAGQWSAEGGDKAADEYARIMRTQLQDLCDRAESGLELAADKKGRKRKACGIGIFVFRDD